MKILVIRLSSIGDVVLTTPVLRCLKEQMPDCELHLITKKVCGELMENGEKTAGEDTCVPGGEQTAGEDACVPGREQSKGVQSSTGASDPARVPNGERGDNSFCYIDQLIEYDGTDEQVAKLKSEGYDYVIDLHNNHRSRRLRRGIGVRTFVYRKENFGKFMLVLLKWDIMSGRHVVDRYFDAVKPLGVKNDGKGLELAMYDVRCTMFDVEKPYVVIACGAQHETKRIPPEKIALMARNIQLQVVLVGDKKDCERMESVQLSDNVVNLCGKTTLQESAAVISGATVVVTSDSAMMHVAAAYKRKVIAIWGCTSPRFGFWAYGTEHIDFTAEGLHCRPCRRMGTERCPKGHFDCMMKQDYNKIISLVNDEKNNIA